MTESTAQPDPTDAGYESPADLLAHISRQLATGLARIAHADVRTPDARTPDPRTPDAKSPGNAPPPRPARASEGDHAA